MTRAAIYFRVSSDKQEKDGTSLDTQLASCQGYAAEQGYTVVAEFQETFSGNFLDERP